MSFFRGDYGVEVHSVSEIRRGKFQGRMGGFRGGGGEGVAIYENPGLAIKT